MSSVFTKIIQRKIPANILAEDEHYIAFLDINPLVNGHTLVVPKNEIDYIFDLSDEELAGLHLFAKKVAVAMEKAIECKRIGVAVIGLEVPHVHVHLVPLNSMQDINFSKPKLNPSKEELQQTANSIQHHLK
jgi:histidine triad (HIT) family protein